MEIVSLLAVFALIKKVYDTAAYATSGKWTSLINQVIAFALGIGAAFLAANADYFEKIDLGNGVVLGSLNGAALVLIGLSWAGAASLGKDYLKASDSTQSEAVPPLVGSE